jgi:hypothetical protein
MIATLHLRLAQQLRKLSAYGCCIEAAAILEKMPDETECATGARRFADKWLSDQYWNAANEAFIAGTKFARGEA